MDFLKEVVTKVLSYGQNSFNRNQNLDILKRKLEEINEVKEDIRAMADEGLRAPRKKVKREVNTWFHKVETKNEEAKVLANKVAESGFFSLVGEEVKKGIADVDELLVQGRSFDSFVIDGPEMIGQVLSTNTLFGEDPKKLMEKIWEYLTDDRVSKIGVYGMGGVGKTTTMKAIHNRLLEIGRFNKVIWVTVSKEINMAKIQDRIAEAIKGSVLDDEDETLRAGKLKDLMVNLGKYVLILDDLWQNISLEELGIPDCSNGSKLVITTRLLDVCHYLDCKKIRVPPLQQSDAWNLFLEKVGKDVEQYPDILPFVRSVAKECGGLPLAIVTIASSMKGVRDTPAWRNALRELKRQVKSVSGENEMIFQKLQFSYDRLGDENVKLCFLSCALYPEDHNIDIDVLMNLWIAEGYVGEMNSLQAELDRGRVILEKLKHCCLIEDGDHGDRVKLHDVLRDMALHLTSSRPRFFVRAGMQLKMKPDVREWKENVEKISLMMNYWYQIPSQMSPPNCPKLTTLLLSNCGIDSIPECFFEQMPMLRILDLSDNYPLTSLPNSISNLESLTTLLLGNCRSIEEMPSLSKLKDLKKLDLHYTGIEEVPHGIDELVELRYLDLSYTNIRKMDVGLILEKLTSLLFLDIPLYDNHCHPSGIELGGTVSSKLLAQLEGLEMQFRDLEEFNSYMQALEDRFGREGEWLYHYKFFVGDLWYIYDPLLGRRMKSIAFYKYEIGTENIRLLYDVEILEFADIIINGGEWEVILSNLITCWGNVSFSSLKRFFCRLDRGNMKKMFSFSWASRNLLNLEELYISSNYDELAVLLKESLEEIIGSLEEIIGSESEFDEGTIKLPLLRILSLEDLPKLKSICSEKVSLECDSIEEIKLWGCPKLKRIPLIFSLGDDGLPSPPLSLKRIQVDSKEWWESAQWDQPQAKSKVEHLLEFLLTTENEDTDASE